MNKKRIFQMVVGVVCVIVGVLLFGFKTDVQFANLTPSEGSKYLIPMKTGVSYDQDIVIHNKIVSKLGLYVMNIHPLLGHVGTIHVALMRGSTVLGEGDIDSSAINRLDISQPIEVSLPYPVASAQDETLRMRITVSDTISTDIALRNRTEDNDFSGEGVAFSIDGVPRELPIAYTAYERLYPALMKQVGGLIIAFGIALLGLPFFLRRKLVADHAILLGIALLQSFSALDSGVSYKMYGLLVAFAVLISWWTLRLVGRSRLAALFGACIAACSTWLPLLLISSLAEKTQLSIRDALFDPNQIAVSHGAGAYIGFFALFFALVGIAVMLWGVIADTRARRMVDAIVFMLLVLSAIVAFAHMFIVIPLATIPVALGMAWFAALGMDAFEQFLGRRDIFVRTLLTLLVCIAVLDLMHVASVSLLYGSGV